ncbi:MAG: hypothetical protein ABIP78_10950 [Pyrinomonadaceae bacterium]
MSKNVKKRLKNAQKRANWQTCKRRRDLRGRWVALYVTMNPRGEISMSRLTYDTQNDGERQHLTDKCEKYETDINTAVYSLYNLTPDEIKLVENA